MSKPTLTDYLKARAKAQGMNVPSAVLGRHSAAELCACPITVNAF